jgi:hypothetical protein
MKQGIFTSKNAQNPVSYIPRYIMRKNALVRAFSFIPWVKPASLPAVLSQ